MASCSPHTPLLEDGPQDAGEVAVAEPPTRSQPDYVRGANAAIALKSIIKIFLVVGQLCIVVSCETGVFLQFFDETVLFGSSSFAAGGQLRDCLSGASLSGAYQNCMQFIDIRTVTEAHEPSLFDSAVRGSLRLAQKLPFWAFILASLGSAATSLTLFGAPKLPREQETMDEMQERIGQVPWYKHLLVLALALSSLAGVFSDIRASYVVVVEGEEGVWLNFLSTCFVFVSSTVVKTAFGLLGLRLLYLLASHRLKVRTSQLDAGAEEQRVNFTWKEAPTMLWHSLRLSGLSLELAMATQGWLWVHWSRAVGSYVVINFVIFAFAGIAAFLCLVLVICSGNPDLRLINPPPPAPGGGPGS